MERHVDLSLLSVKTEVSVGLLYPVCHLKFLNHLMSILYTSSAELKKWERSNFILHVIKDCYVRRSMWSNLKNIIVLYSINLS